MNEADTSPAHLNTFITRWDKAEAAERANYVLFLSELCDLLDVPRPDPAGADTETNAYVFERAVTFHHRGSTKTSTGRIDLYKRDCFVCECKQYAHAKKTEPAELSFDLTDDARKSPKIARGSAAWDRAMLEAHSQAEDYATRLPTNENPPPFLLVVDVGHVIELFADFTQRGKAYLPFPDARSHRIKLTDLANPDLRERLRQVWTTPAALDPSKRAAAGAETGSRRYMDTFISGCSTYPPCCGVIKHAFGGEFMSPLIHLPYSGPCTAFLFNFHVPPKSIASRYSRPTALAGERRLGGRRFRLPSLGLPVDRFDQPNPA